MNPRVAAVVEYAKQNHVRLAKTGAVVAGFVYAARTKPEVAVSMLASVATRLIGAPEQHAQHHEKLVNEFFDHEVREAGERFKRRMGL
jgi:hypothetical protein